jgi:hypothetical protein
VVADSMVTAIGVIVNNRITSTNLARLDKFGIVSKFFNAPSAIPDNQKRVPGKKINLEIKK